MAKLVRTGTETLKRRRSLLHRQWHPVGEGLEAKVADGRVFIRDQKTKAERVSLVEEAIDDIVNVMVGRARRARQRLPQKKRRRAWKISPVSIWVDYKGFDYELDKRIEKFLRKHRDGSGYSFMDVRRDLSFGYARRDVCIRAAERLKKAFPKCRVRVEGRVWP